MTEPGFSSHLPHFLQKKTRLASVILVYVRQVMSVTQFFCLGIFNNYTGVMELDCTFYYQLSGDENKNTNTAY